MKLKKSLAILATIALCSVSNFATMTERSIWAEATPFNTDFTIKNVQKVVLFPVKKGGEFQNALVGEEAEFNKYLAKRLQEKIKNVTFISSMPSLGTAAVNTSILAPNLSAAERGEQAAAQGADAYVIATIRKDAARVDRSSAKEVPVTYKEYQKIKNGPHGDETINYHSWESRYTVSEHSKTLRQVNVDFDVYNTQGNKIFTMTEDYHVYDVEKSHAYRQLINRFSDSWKDLKPAKINQTAPLKLQLKPITTAVAVNDDSWRSVQYAYSREPEHMKNFRLLPNDSLLTPDYYVTAKLTAYGDVEVWHEPSASGSEKLVRTHYRDYYDKNGKKQRMTIEDYETRFTEYGGYYDIEGEVTVDLSLVHAGSGAIVAQQSITQTGETPAEALHKAFHKFFKEVDKLSKK